MKFTFQPESKPLDGFTIKRAIDRGGFGEVYYALSDSGKEVALKLLQRNMDIELRGIRQCMNLKHPNLMTIFDVKTDSDGDHWVIMEYMSGHTLEQILNEHPQGMPMEEVLRWLEGIAAGAAYLHDRGVVHRDLKPANLFIDAGVVKIGDIGLSKYITPSRRSGHTESVGTVHYMAPEVAHGRYGNELDVYSTAVMVYEMITGTVPFDGESTGEIIMKHLTEKPNLSKLPEKLQPIIAKALEKDPNERTHSIAQFARHVKEAILGSNGATRPKVATEIPEESFVERTAYDNVSSGHARPKPHRHEQRRERESRRPQRHRKHWRQKDEEDFPSKQGLFWILFAIIAVVAALGPGQMFRASLVVGVVGGIGYFLYWLFFMPYKPPRVSHEGDQRLRDEIDQLRGQPAAEGPPQPPVQPVPVAVAKQQRPIQPQMAAVKREKKKKWYRKDSTELTPSTIRPVSLRDRTASAAQSMTLAVLFSMPVVAVIAFLLPEMQEPGRLGLFGLTTVLGSWMVLAPSKLWEGSSLEPMIRRMVLLSAGVVVGAAAYGLDEMLLVDVPELTHERWPKLAMFQSVGNRPLFLQVSNAEKHWFQYQPTLAAYVVFFAALFGIRRWWWHADSFRLKRFRVSSLLLSGIVGILITYVFAFPRGWAILWALAISAVVQLSATWAPTQVRPAMMEEK